MERNLDDDPPKTCFVCRKQLTATGQHLCSKCRTVSYCSTKCQRVHWKGGHKYVCREGFILIGETPIRDEQFYHKFWGFCLDCVDEKNKNEHKKKLYNSSHYCDECSLPYICDEHEQSLRVCKKCRDGNK